MQGDAENWGAGETTEHALLAPPASESGVEFLGGWGGTGTARAGHAQQSGTNISTGARSDNLLRVEGEVSSKTVVECGGGEDWEAVEGQDGWQLLEGVEGGGAPYSHASAVAEQDEKAADEEGHAANHVEVDRFQSSSTRRRTADPRFPFVLRCLSRPPCSLPFPALMEQANLTHP
jgi:hypothetical protein